MARSDFRFVHPLRVRWSEVDMQGVVFNGHYLNFFDVAQTEFLRAIGAPYPAALSDRAWDLQLVKTTLEFRGPARFDDQLEIGVRVARLGRSSLTFNFEVLGPNGPDPLVIGESVYVHVDLRTGRSAPTPAELRERIEAYQAGPPGPEAAVTRTGDPV